MVANVVTRSVVLMGLLISVLVTGSAQESPQTPLTLNEAVELALANDPALGEARAGSLAASAETRVARTAYLPRLDFLWQTNRATRNNLFGLLLPKSVIPPVSGPVLGTDALESVWSSAGGLLLSWEVVDFGRRAGTVDLARSEADFADAQRQVTELEVAAAAADAFLGVLAADAMHSAARTRVNRDLEELLDIDGRASRRHARESAPAGEPVSARKLGEIL